MNAFHCNSTHTKYIQPNENHVYMHFGRGHDRYDKVLGS